MVWPAVHMLSCLARGGSHEVAGGKGWLKKRVLKRVRRYSQSSERSAETNRSARSSARSRARALLRHAPYLQRATHKYSTQHATHRMQHATPYVPTLLRSVARCTGPVPCWMRCVGSRASYSSQRRTFVRTNAANPSALSQLRTSAHSECTFARKPRIVRRPRRSAVHRAAF